MKYLLFIFTIIFSISVTWSQTDNYQKINHNRIDKINQRIKENVATGEYEKAGQLQKEQKIRLQLQEAYKSQASEKRIAELQSNLIHCNCTPSSLDNEMDQLKNTISKWKHQDQYRKDNFVLYTEFLVANYMNTATNQISNQHFYDENGNYLPPNGEEQRVFNDLIGLGFKIGSSFYFNDMDKNKNFKVGFDLVYFSFIVGISNDYGDIIYSPNMIVLNFPQPGVVLNQYFSSHSGLEIRANAGIVKSFGFDLTGISGRLSAQFWTGKLSVGVNYQYSSSLIYEKFNSGWFYYPWHP